MSPTLRDWWDSLTRTEVHAAVLGFAAGIVTGFTWVAGMRDTAGMIAVTSLAAAGIVKGVQKAPNEALSQIRREPWYYLGLYAVSLLGVVLLGGGF